MTKYRMNRRNPIFQKAFDSSLLSSIRILSVVCILSLIFTSGAANANNSDYTGSWGVSLRSNQSNMSFAARLDLFSKSQGILGITASGFERLGSARDCKYAITMQNESWKVIGIDDESSDIGCPSDLSGKFERSELDTLQMQLSEQSRAIFEGMPDVDLSLIMSPRDYWLPEADLNLVDTVGINLTNDIEEIRNELLSQGYDERESEQQARILNTGDEIYQIVWKFYRGDVDGADTVFVFSRMGFSWVEEAPKDPAIIHRRLVFPPSSNITRNDIIRQVYDKYSDLAPLSINSTNKSSGKWYLTNNPPDDRNVCESIFRMGRDPIYFATANKIHNPYDSSSNRSPTFIKSFPSGGNSCSASVNFRLNNSSNEVIDFEVILESEIASQDDAWEIRARLFEMQFNKISNSSQSDKKLDL